MDTRPLPVHYSRRAALRHSATHPRGLPPGARRPDPDTPPPPTGAPVVPVILIHGTNGRSSCDWYTLAPLLANDGRDVYPFDWRRARPGPDGTATHRHALELAAFIDTVRATTGATQVDVVGHSWGAVLAHYLVRCLPAEPAAGAVRSVIGLAPTYGGTTLHGLLRHPHRLPAGLRRWLDAKIPTWQEQLPGSEVLTAIRNAPPAPAVRFTTIVTRYDQMVTPYTASLAAAPHATQVVLQQRTRRPVIGHLGILHHPASLSHVLTALPPIHPHQPA
ncbi:alpha/beta fold hydrolase [Actinoplanes regularis]|uniref:Alpha/beta hydrolase fold n=1 Tax=Actinoplanes regularis TaxID=52697 RepID=A0A238V7B1_9ACTN|nr:alpha/beta fold hydrolase [Actinoplanes regularis]GIE83818.1 lipase [Actinoplanes regularis]SNR29937.1 alpha/beta hydrolase fold [Actinoplanes regularis]